jgi:hypothetical protein
MVSRPSSEFSGYCPILYVLSGTIRIRLSEWSDGRGCCSGLLTPAAIARLLAAGCDRCFWNYLAVTQALSSKDAFW